MQLVTKVISVSLLLTWALAVIEGADQTTNDYSSTSQSFESTPVTKNDYASTSHFFETTTITKKPSTPRDFTASGQNYTSIILSWNEPAEWNGDPVGYDFWVFTESGDEIFSIRLKGKDNRRIRVTGLKASTNYSLHLRAVSQVSEEEVQSEMVLLKAQTKKAGPPSAPRDFTASRQTYTSMDLSWNQPSEWNGEPVGYDLRIDTENDSDVFTIRLRGKGIRKFGLTDLDPGVNYTMHLRAVNQVSGQEVEGETALLVTQTVEVGTPSVVRNLQLASQSPTKIAITWEQPEHWGGLPTGYKILVSTPSTINTYLVGKDETHFTCDTEVDANISVYVSAYITYNHKRIEGLTDSLYIPSYSTRAPTPPQNFRVLYDEITENAVLRWDQPLNWNGPEGGYVITYADETGVSRIIKLKGEGFNRFTPSGMMPDSHYTFSLIAFNDVKGGEMNSKPVVLNVRTFPPERPHMPRNLKPVSVSSTSLTIIWDKPTEGDVDSYEVTHVTQKAEIKDIVKETKITLSNLQPWTNYLITVASIKFVGNKTVSSDHAMLIQQTNFSVPSPPVLLHAVPASDSSLTLSWSAPLIPNGPIEGYVVSWSEEEGGKVDKTTTVKTTYTIKSLKAWTKYDFNVTAYNSLKVPGMISEPVNLPLKTDVSAPGVVGSLVIYRVSNTSMSLKWVEPQIKNGPISGYRVIFTNTKSGLSENFTTPVNNCTLQKLKPWTDYHITVEAYNTLERDVHTNVFGPPTPGFQKTTVGSPTAPTNLEVQSVSNSTIDITWDRPEEPNGPISGYFVRDFNTTNTFFIVNDTSYTFEDLTPWKNYSISVVAFNYDGKSSALTSPDATIEERTSPSAPPYASTKLSIGKIEKESASLEFPQHLFSNEHGEIVEYVLLVAASKSKSNTQDQGFESLNETIFPSWKDTKNTENWYRSSHVKWDIDIDTSICSTEGTSRKCVIGKDSKCSDQNEYCDAALTSDTQYWAKIRAYTVAGWTETFPVSFKTAANGAVQSTLGAAVFLMMPVIRILCN